MSSDAADGTRFRGQLYQPGSIRASKVLVRRIADVVGRQLFSDLCAVVAAPRY
jgi:hypothetical protein